MRIASRTLARTLARPALLTLLGIAAVGAPATAAAADTGPASGHVYVDDNTAGTNTIAVFDRHADGHLTTGPGSPFATGGAGTGTGLTSQGALQLTSDGRFVVAVDAGSNTVSVLRVQDGGRLKAVHAGTVSSGGSHPVSVAVHGSLVYVANAGVGGSNYTGFRLTANGRLRPIAGSTVQLPDDAQPGDVLFNGDGTKLVGTRINSSLIDSFAVGSGGLLTAAPGSPYAAQGVGPFGSEFRPTNPNQLYVSNAHDGPGAGSVSAFDVSGAGVLSPIGSSPFADQQTAACWIAITNAGDVLFTVNTASGSISRYAIAADGALTLLGSTPVGASGGLGAVDAGVTPDDSALYVDESRIASIGEFAVAGGNLTELPGSPVALPAGATPAGIAVG